MSKILIKLNFFKVKPMNMGGNHLSSSHGIPRLLPHVEKLITLTSLIINLLMRKYIWPVIREEPEREVFGYNDDMLRFFHHNDHSPLDVSSTTGITSDTILAPGSSNISESTGCQETLQGSLRS